MRPMIRAVLMAPITIDGEVLGCFGLNSKQPNTYTEHHARLTTLFAEHVTQAVRNAGLEQAFEFTGYVAYELLPNLYRRLSVFVAPVWKESFGQVGPFAMNMGLPVVGYDVGAIADIIDDRTLVAPPGDPTKLADIIVRLLDNREERLTIGSKNMKRAKLLYSIEPMIASYRKLYQEACDPGKKLR